MNPSREGQQQPSFELPVQPESNEIPNQRQEKGQEAPAARPEQAGKQVQQPALPVVPDDLPVADTPAIPAPAGDDNSPAHQSYGGQGSDDDRIEPIWLDRAKAVISQTKSDPYEQKVQMSKVKAEYIQKRFNKQVKTDETHK